jgi:uncharacterized protein YcfL
MKKKLIPLVMACLFLAGCTCTEFKAYVIADRLNYNADVALKTSLIDQASNISQEDKDTFKARLQAKEQAITEAEKLLGIK